MKTAKQKETSHKAGFASILYVLVLGIALLGVLFANLYPNQVKNKIIAAEINKQNMNAIVEADAYNIARGTVKHIAIGMEDPATASNLGSTLLYKPYDLEGNSLVTQLDNTSDAHEAQVRASDTEGINKTVSRSSKASLPNSNPQPEAIIKKGIEPQALAYGPQNGSYGKYNLSQDTILKWGSPNYETQTTPFNLSASQLGIPTLHANYTYGLGHPAEYFSNEVNNPTYTIRPGPNSVFESPLPPLNLNAFSGWGHYINPRATNGYALYPAELFPGLAMNGKPMLGRLHVFKYDRKFTLNNAKDQSDIPVRYRVRVMLMEIPFQSALDYEGELQVNTNTFWDSAVIQGTINTDKITGAGVIKTKGSNAGVQTQTGVTGAIVMNNSTLDDNSLVTASKKTRDESRQDLQVRKNTHNMSDARTMVRSFLVNPARLGSHADKRNWFEWPTGGTHQQSADTNKYQTNFADTNTGGGPTIDQYTCGVLQTDLHLRVDKLGPHTILKVYKMRANGMAYVGRLHSNPSEGNIQPGYTALGSSGENFETAIGLTPSTITLNLEAISRLFKANMGGTRQITNREWPIRGISIYKDPNSDWTGSDPNVVIQDAVDLNNYHEGLSIVSQFSTEVSQSFNFAKVDAAAMGPAWRYKGDPMLVKLNILPANLRLPAAIYAPRLQFFSAGGSPIGKLTVNGAIAQRGTAPFLPPTSSGANPITNDYKTKKIASTGKLNLSVYNDTFNGLEELNLTGVRHQVELPPIVPTKWLVTYIIENYH